MSELIIVLKATKKLKLAELDMFRDMFLRQMKDGLIVVPDYFEVATVNPEQLKCQIEEVENE